METELKEKLNNNIWVTRKCRINASERLLRNARFIELLNVWYSIFVIFFSLLSYVNHDDKLSFVSLICSIALTISIVYANSVGYRERSNALKQNYIELQLLLDQLMDPQSGMGALDISERYGDLLKASENHLPIDLYRVKNNASDEQFKLKGIEKWTFLIYMVKTCILKVALFALPIVILLLHHYGVI